MAFKQFVSRSCFACACFLYYGSACCLWTSFLPKPSFVVHLGLTRGSKSRHWNGQYEMHWGRRADTTLSRLLIVIFYLSQLTKKGDDIFNILQKRLNVNTRSIHLSIHPSSRSKSRMRALQVVMRKMNGCNETLQFGRITLSSSHVNKQAPVWPIVLLSLLCVTQHLSIALIVFTAQKCDGDEKMPDCKCHCCNGSERSGGPVNCTSQWALRAN